MPYLKEVQAAPEIVISREPLAAKVAARLREWILLEQLAPGAVVTERELAERLGVSRTPMREALRILAEEELIDMQVNRRPRIAKPSLERVLDLLDVLTALETLATRLCIQRASADEVAVIASMQRQLHRLAGSRGAPLDFFNTEMSLHHSIVTASHNAPLVASHRQIGAAVFRARFLASRSPENRSVTLVEMDIVVDAIVQRQEENAVRSLHHHLETVRSQIAALFPATIPFNAHSRPGEAASAAVKGSTPGAGSGASQHPDIPWD